MNATNLIEILKSASHNMDVPLEKMQVKIVSPEGWAYELDCYEQFPEKETLILISK